VRCEKGKPAAEGGRAKPKGFLIGEAKWRWYSEEPGLLIETVPHRGAHRQRKDFSVRRIILIALSVMLALLVAIPMASGKPVPTGRNPSPPGLLKQLGAEWWIWALEEPTATNPLLGDYTDGPQCDGFFNKAGGIFFLAGTIFAEDVPATRECTVPHKTRLFFPIMNTFQAEMPGTPAAKTEAEYRAFVNNCIDEALVDSTMFVKVDGKPVPISIKKQRADTPLFSFDLPPDNIFGAPSGVYEGVADGVWVLLPRLSKGEHIITFGGDFPNNPEECGGPFEQNNTYKLTVE